MSGGATVARDQFANAIILSLSCRAITARAIAVHVPHSTNDPIAEMAAIQALAKDFAYRATVPL